MSRACFMMSGICYLVSNLAKNYIHILVSFSAIFLSRLIILNNLNLLRTDLKYLYICRMKLMAAFLAFYVLILSGIPCNANDTCLTEGIGHRVNADKSKDQADHKNADCPCSPFFACSNCHGVAIPGSGIDFPRHIQTIAKKVFGHIDSRLTDFPVSIFQPPQLS